MSRRNGNRIRARLAAAGVRQREVARRLGVSPALVSLVVSGRRRSPRVRAALAAACGSGYRRLWGEDDPGQPERRKAS